MRELASEEDWEACVEASKAAPVFVLKHSTACAISAMGFREVQKYEQARGDGDPPVYVVKVIESRPVSNAIAEDLEVPHRSPQLILMKDGEAVWNASHHGIYVDRIRETASGAH